jgi:hypothetical protein
MAHESPKAQIYQAAKPRLIGNALRSRRGDRSTSKEPAVSVAKKDNLIVTKFLVCNP